MNKKNVRKPKTIIIADDHHMVAQGLTSIIHEFSPYKVIATVTDGKILLRKLNTLKPNMVLLDVNMPNLNGIDTAQILRKRYPEIKIVIITSYGHEVLDKLKNSAQVDGFISKMSDGSLIIKSLIEIMKGGKIFVNPNLLPENGNGVNDVYMKKLKLSARQLELLRLIKNGLSTKDIADKLFLSIYTVETHRKNICRKLKISTPNALVKWAHENEI